MNNESYLHAFFAATFHCLLLILLLFKMHSFFFHLLEIKRGLFTTSATTNLPEGASL